MPGAMPRIFFGQESGRAMVNADELAMMNSFRSLPGDMFQQSDTDQGSQSQCYSHSPSVERPGWQWQRQLAFSRAFTAHSVFLQKRSHVCSKKKTHSHSGEWVPGNAKKLKKTYSMNITRQNVRR